MKRSEMIDKIRRETEENWDYEFSLSWIEADNLLKFIENLGMLPPEYMKPIPFHEGKQYPLVPGDFKNDQGIWCTPGVTEWEPED